MNQEFTRDSLQTALQAIGQAPLPQEQARCLEDYLDLLMRWNLKVNLTSVRDRQGMIQRHLLEAIHFARLMPSEVRTMLDYGSGGGVPGIPCAVCCPAVLVTMAESQGRKAGFLREAVRSLGLSAAVYYGRVEAMDPDAVFDMVALRAVDSMQEACTSAQLRIKAGGWVGILTTRAKSTNLMADLEGLAWRDPENSPGSEQRVLLFGQKL